MWTFLGLIVKDFINTWDSHTLIGAFFYLMWLPEFRVTPLLFFLSQWKCFKFLFSLLGFSKDFLTLNKLLHFQRFYQNVIVLPMSASMGDSAWLTTPRACSSVNVGPALREPSARRPLIVPWIAGTVASVPSTNSTAKDASVLKASFSSPLFRASQKNRNQKFWGKNSIKLFFFWFQFSGVI